MSEWCQYGFNHATGSCPACNQTSIIGLTSPTPPKAYSVLRRVIQLEERVEELERQSREGSGHE